MSIHGVWASNDCGLSEVWARMSGEGVEKVPPDGGWGWCIVIGAMLIGWVEHYLTLCILAGEKKFFIISESYLIIELYKGSSSR